MGVCGSSSQVVKMEELPMTKLQTMQWSDVVVMPMHLQGAFAMRADGTYEKLEKNPQLSFWKAMKHFGALGLALPGSRLVTFGQSSPTVLDMENNTMTVLGKSRWSNGTSAVVRPLSSSDTVLAFHDFGLFSVNVNDGSYEQLSKEGWKMLKCLVVDPEKDIAYAFHDMGTYKVDLTTGTSEKLSSERWSQAKCALWSPSGIMVLHFDGIYRVDVQTGKSERVSKEGWSQASHAVDVGDGTALVFHSDGIYKLNLSDATYSKVENAGSWHALHGVWAMRPEVRCVNQAVPGSSAGGNAGAGVC
jgi:hypothetical protein